MTLLSGVRVLEISSYVATPLCGLVLTQLGADVIRVEPPGGAPDRARLPLSAEGASLYWSGLNKGKRAITADLRDPQERDLIARLAMDASIVVTNGHHGGPLAADALRAQRPDLIHLQLTGQSDGCAGVDYTTQAWTGFPSVTGPRGHAAGVNHVLPAWDVAAGLYLATGLLAALHRRDHSGEGARLTLALDDVALSTAGHLGYLAEAQTRGCRRGGDGNYVYGTYGRDFALADGRQIMLVVLTERHWRSLCAVTGLAEAIQALESAMDIDLSDEQSRYTHRDLISALLEPWFAQRALAEVERDLADCPALWLPYRDFDEIAATLDEHPLFARLDQPGVGAHYAPGSPLVIDGERIGVARAPSIGEHTAEVLAPFADDEAAGLPYTTALLTDLTPTNPLSTDPPPRSTL